MVVDELQLGAYAQEARRGRPRSFEECPRRPRHDACVTQQVDDRVDRLGRAIATRIRTFAPRRFVGRIVLLCRRPRGEVSEVGVGNRVTSRRALPEIQPPRRLQKRAGLRRRHVSLLVAPCLAIDGKVEHRLCVGGQQIHQAVDLWP
jgi:hypothetical protein